MSEKITVNGTCKGCGQGYMVEVDAESENPDIDLEATYCCNCDYAQRVKMLKRADMRIEVLFGEDSEQTPIIKYLARQVYSFLIEKASVQIDETTKCTVSLVKGNLTIQRTDTDIRQETIS